MGNKLVVTGLTGKKSGGAFAKRLAGKWDSIIEKFPDGVRAVVRQTSNTEMLKRLLPDVELSICELSDEKALQHALEGADTVFHVAGIHNSRQIVRAAASCGVRRLITVHTTGIYSRYKKAGEEYRRIDGDVERICRENGIALTILRPTMIYGNLYDNNLCVFIRMVANMPLMPIVNGGVCELQPVHYDDLADAYYLTLMNEASTAGKNFILSGGEAIPFRDMLTKIGGLLGKDVRFIDCPFPLAYGLAWVLFYLTFGRKDYREKVQRLCESRAYPHDEAMEAFGYRPSNLSEGLVPEIAEYLALSSLKRAQKRQ